MTSVTSGKIAFFRISVSFTLAVLALTGAYFLCDGPKLGRLFDFLLSKQSESTVSQEILLIETTGANAVVDPSTAALVIGTLAEMGAGSLVVQTPILGVSYAPAEREVEMAGLFSREFNMIDRNIVNLFDGIRMGTIAPEDSPRFVGAVLELAHSAEARLVNETVRTNAASIKELAEAIELFPKTFIAGDRLDGVSPTAQVTGGAPSGGQPSAGALFSRVSPDADGRFRRVLPTGSDGESDFEHIVFGALKSRFGFTALSQNPAGNFLIMEKTPALPSIDDRRFVLDNGGELIFRPSKNGFRKIDLDEILEYESLDRAIYKTLSDNSDLGTYGLVGAENYPSYLWEREKELKKNLFIPPVIENSRINKKAESWTAWKNARDAALKSLDVFFNEAAIEKNINEGFDKLLKDENLNEAGEARALAIRDNLIEAFQNGKTAYIKFDALHEKLQRELALSFCIMATPSPDTQVSAELANAILSGVSVVPAQERYILLCAIVVSFLCVFILRTPAPFMTLVVGFSLCTAVLIGFSYSFILTSIWLNPLIPLSGAVFGTLSSVLFSLILKLRHRRTIRVCYGPFVSKPLLKQLLRACDAEPRCLKKAEAAIVAVKNPALFHSQKSVHTAKALVKFRSEARSFFLEKGAVIAGVDGGTIIAAFGSPLEKANKAKKKSAESPAVRAEKAIEEMTLNGSKWFFAADYGEYAFAWTPLSGYAAYGVQNVVSLLSQCPKQKKRVLFSDNFCARKSM
jgi:hypothetical protein